jgi:hypothetical protein
MTAESQEFAAVGGTAQSAEVFIFPDPTKSQWRQRRNMASDYPRSVEVTPE